MANNANLVAVLSMVFVLVGCQLGGGKPSGAKDGYFTWVDDQGRVRHTPIPKTESENSPEDSPLQAKASDSSNTTSNTSDQPESQKSQAGVDSHPEYNLDNYPDGDALAKRGHIRPGDAEPYFTWRDSQGNVRVSYYRPDTRTAVEKGEIKPPLELTEANIYQAAGEASPVELPDGADPLAAAVLNLKPLEAPFFERWSNACCSDLDRSDAKDWESGREFGVAVEGTANRHDFVTGESHYRLVRLPKGGEINDFILQLRSFNSQGLFVPTVAFLDERFKPVRLVTDLVSEFIPESWHRQAHLRSYIPVFPSEGERWLLIYTTTEDLAGQTVYDSKFGPRAIQHVGTGELGLEQVVD